jgi:hypothetical protein
LRGRWIAPNGASRRGLQPTPISAAFNLLTRFHRELPLSGSI